MLNTRLRERWKLRKATEIRVDFSFKREVFFVVIGAMLGGISMLIPTAFEVGMGLPYYVIWVAFGHVVGIYSSDAAFAGIAIHTLTAISIGVVIGVFLYKTGILNISKLSNGFIYGLFAGTVVLIVFFIPVYLLILHPEINRILTGTISETYDEYGTTISIQLPTSDYKLCYNASCFWYHRRGNFIYFIH